MAVRWREKQPPPNAYVEFLRNKRVVLVGPAASLDGRRQGALIDGHDVVVRMNLGSPVKPELHERLYPGDRPRPVPEDLGTRTDVLFHVLYSKNHLRQLGRQHTASEVQCWLEDGVRFLVTRHDRMNERVQMLLPALGNALPLISIDQGLKARVRQETRTNPNSGVLAIAHLLSMPIASLYVTGFDFYASAYGTGYGGFTAEQASKGGGDGVGYAAWGQTGSTREIHRQDGQKDYLAKLYRKEPRLAFDDVAAAALGLQSPGPCIVALVPMKGESERVPGKNMRMLAGKPLLYWTLRALHESARVSRVVVDTDSEDIAALVCQEFPRTQVLMRPEELQGQMVTGNRLIEWEISQVDGEHFGQFHVTSPLLTPETIDRAVEAYFAGLEPATARGRTPKHDSLMSVTKHQFWLFRGDGSAVNSDVRNLVRSQDLEPLYEDNNAMHLFSRASFGKTGSRIGERPQMFEMSKIEATDIDWPEDFQIAEALMAWRLAHA